MSGLLIESDHRSLLLVDISNETGWYYGSFHCLVEEGFIAPLKEFGWTGLDLDDKECIKSGKPLFREELMKWDW